MLSSLSESQCKERGYEWVNLPGLCGGTEDHSCGYRCDIKTKDPYKQCYSNNECEGVCSCGNNKKDSEGFSVGQCSVYKYYTEIVDCPCILENKTKIRPVYACA